MSETRGAAAYRSLVAELREIALFGTSAALLAWDQETMMPPKGAELRADQLAALSALTHARHTRPEIGEWLAECEADDALLADEATAANLREIRRDYDRAARLPETLVREMARTTALAQQAWRAAREADAFTDFSPWLDKVLQLSRAKAECYRRDDTSDPYDLLLDEFEPGMTSAAIESVFQALRAALVPLIAEIATAPAAEPRTQSGSIPIPLQRDLCADVAARIGFDFGAGRLDVSAHPFCQGLGAGDTRLTTRFREDLFTDALSSTMHETGHGLYEQGLPTAEYFGQPLAEAVSLGIHESQSRLWENMVGRSLPFWRWALPRAREVLGTAVDGIGPEEMYRAVNRVAPNLIRVDSDEATYNLHIMLRFDLERALLAGDLAVADLPTAWNDRVLADLGLDVPNDRLGCLQDIHWSMGAIGYFPTYTLGTIFAAQFWAAIVREIPDVGDSVARGEFEPVLEWLRRNIHRHGRRYTALELCELATGSSFSAEPFVDYLESKFRPLYGLNRDGAGA